MSQHLFKYPWMYTHKFKFSRTFSVKYSFRVSPAFVVVFFNFVKHALDLQLNSRMILHLELLAARLIINFLQYPSTLRKKSAKWIYCHIFCQKLADKREAARYITYVNLSTHAHAVVGIIYSKWKVVFNCNGTTDLKRNGVTDYLMDDLPHNYFFLLYFSFSFPNYVYQILRKGPRITAHALRDKIVF